LELNRLFILVLVFVLAASVSVMAAASDFPGKFLSSEDLDAIDPNLDGSAMSGTLERMGEKSGLPQSSPDIAATQILLDRLGLSPGAINGVSSRYLDRAKRIYRQRTGQELPDNPAGVRELLAKSGGEAFSEYAITQADVAGPFLRNIPARIQDQGGIGKLNFRSVSEAIAERFHMDENYLTALNPGKDFSIPGTRIKVASTGKPLNKWVSRIHADKALKQLTAFDLQGNILAIYPASIGSRQTPSPNGVFRVISKAGFPSYTLAPDNEFERIDNGKQVIVAPGPNNPVGSAWIGLSAPGYGIHGTPDPSAIGKAESNGCIRLTNWDAMELARLVRNGVVVTIE
jgi:lipoprotein-anchoring transpeptidase ErfK/SrfK